MTLTALTTLEEVLREYRGDEICFEIDASASPSACFRSSNSSFLVPVPLKAAEALLEHIKNRACLDTTTPARPQSGLLPIGERIYRINYCPQGDGAIVVFRGCVMPARTTPGKWTHWKLSGDGTFIAVVEGADVLGALRLVKENYGRYSALTVNGATVDENGQVREEDNNLYDISNLLNEELSLPAPRKGGA